MKNRLSLEFSVIFPGEIHTALLLTSVKFSSYASWED